ncbi:GEVED domain-containing protein [Adhaeribacter terreus]|uniref:GEVED domain-containing protein n=1 Tax=Adhaeribacter terreus TaxID=529703 RepID=A0ABW0EC15_9BACT
MPKPYLLLLRAYLLLFTFFLLNHTVFAQCPVASSCTPGNAPTSTFPFGMGIFNVSVGSGANGFSNATTGGASAGYQDYSCTQKATVLEGVSTSISVTTNPNANENVRAWLDLNNNGIFDQTTELIFSSVNAKVHTGSFTIPASAAVVKNAVLRLRVSADNFSSALPTPCSTPAYSQVEDYGITVVPNTNKPAVAFSVNNPVTCSPTVQFQNLTQNGATSYLWEFGDGTTSNAANPSHTYAATGTYTVKLKACNLNGCDSLTQTNFITYHNTSPTISSCIPTTQNYCCNYGITNVNFGNGLMVNSSANGSVGYEDFTCSKIFTVSAGKSYPITLNTGNILQDVRLYIDLNNDGAFTGPNETILQLFSQVNPVANIIMPTTTFLNVPLRMRIVSDIPGSMFNSCSGIQLGQAEDYTIKIIEPPFATFNYSAQILCDGTVSFSESSMRNPTSWFWNFGDTASGQINYSTLQHPTHTFSSAGIYNVTLKSCNSQGCDSISALINVAKNQSMNLPSVCIPGINFNRSKFAISKVQLGNIINITSDSSHTYFNYACNNFTNLTYGSNNQVSILTHHIEPILVQIWIDMNNDGVFNWSENVFMSASIYNHYGTLDFQPGTNPVRNTYLRMRVRSTGASQVPFPLACDNINVGETEDYAVMFVDPTGISENDFSNSISIHPNPSNGTFSLEIPSIFQEHFQLEVHNLIGQIVAERELKNAEPITQIDLSYLPKGVYLVRVFNHTNSAVKKVVIY